MKSLFKNIAAALALTVILFAGCKNPAEDVQIIVDTDIFKSPMLIQFLNAKAGSEGPKAFTVEVTGSGAGLVRTATGGKVFKTAEGLLNLFLDRTANPSPTSPVKFTIIANATGFAPTYQDIEVTSATDPIIYKVEMIQYANPTAGSGAIVATQAIANGVSGSDITFTTATNAGMTQKSDLTVPSGTGFLDATGQSVGGSQLEARIVYTGTAADGTITNLPGGSFASNVIGANGQPIAAGVYFNAAGSLSINMFGGTKEVKTFTKPVSVDMEVNPSMINPNTNATIKVGETIPMWSLNDETGQWKAEGNATFATSAAGKLVARLQITHLSDWRCAYPSLSCSSSITITRQTDTEEETFSFKGIANTSIGSLVLKKGEKTKTFTGGVVPAGSNILTVTAGSAKYVTREQKTGIVASSSLCNATTTFNFVEKPDLVRVDLDIKFKCTTKDLITGINSFITITPVGANSSQSSSYSLNKGIGSGTITNGVTYKIVASVDGIAYTSQFTADKKNFKLPDGFDLTGTAVYNAGTNRLKITGQVTKSCN
ncbi:MAG: hypothetical protein KAY27_00050 [Pedobacter sp.]|nr:hypothetical protein [Pedobacter sp.]